MAKHFSEAIQFLKDDRIEIRIRMLFLLEYSIIVACILGTVSMIFIHQPWIQIMPNFFLLGMTIMGLVLSHKKKYEIASILLIIVCADIILPIMFFTAGGYNSGMPLWFCFGVLVACLMSKGRSRLLMVTTTILIDVFCILTAQYYPSTVTPLVGELGGYYDMLQSFVVVSIGLCVIFGIHIYTYDKQKKIMEEQQEELTRLMRIDELTGVFNRRAYFDDSRKYYLKYDPSLVLIVMDVNGLKEINDTRGHDAGDELIRKASNAIKEAFSSYGKIYRTGGDEFVALLHCSKEERRSLQERLDSCIQSKGIIDGKRIHVASGIVAWGEYAEDSYREIEKIADSRMYEDKKAFYKMSGKERRKTDTSRMEPGIFGRESWDKNSRTVDYMNQSSFDEKFEVELEKDLIRNIFHVENKYYVPVMTGSFREMYEYGCSFMVHPDDKAFAELMNPDTMIDHLRTSPTPGIIKIECRQKLVDGDYRWVEYIGISGKEHGVPNGTVYFYVYDIQNQRDRESGRSVTSYITNTRDNKTGLLKREMFVQTAQEAIKKQNLIWCCIAIDIQHFKIFNSWYGHDKGDYVIARIGAILKEYELKNKAVAAYFGRDNFGMLMPYREDLIQEIYDKIREIVTSYSNSLGFSPVFGIYLLEKNEKFDLDSYDKARLAVEKAKNSYRDRIQYFDSQFYVRQKEEYALLTEFQYALMNNEITFYVQPQVRISTGKIVGAEALARWVKADGTVISPGRFIPFLESSGFIIELDKCVWEEVFKWIRSILDRDIEPVPVSINISQIDLLSIDVVSYLRHLAKKYQVDPRYLKVEITESAYAENIELISQVITQLQKKGFLVFMDDFGAGYSSLNMLDQINVDVLKLDMAFMRKETSLSKKGISIVESIVNMTRALQLPIIVEGVETEEQIRFLNELGCRYAQGYYFYRPMPVEEYELILKSNTEKFDYDGYQVKSTEIFRTREFLNENLFTDSVLNNILGAVAFYSLDGKDLTITRFNTPFYEAIGDVGMDSRTKEIQHYVVEEDHTFLYRALEEAERNISGGGQCEIRFYKSDGSVFWFHIHFFYLRTEGKTKMFYGQVADVTERRIQSISFFEILRKQAEVTMRINLNQKTIQYVTGDNTLYEVNLPAVDLEDSMIRTMQNRIDNEKDRQAFKEFFDVERLKKAYKKAVYHEALIVHFRLQEEYEPVEISTYCIQLSENQDLFLYVFTKRINE